MINNTDSIEISVTLTVIASVLTYPSYMRQWKELKYFEQDNLKIFAYK